MTDTPMTRWAILGTGVVSRKFVMGLKPLARQIHIAAVASRSAENARQFASHFGIPDAVSTYADAVMRSDVDVVYIATPPSEHEAHALLAIAAGKAVLIEKPFALDASAAQRIVNAARIAGVFCMEAMWTRFLPMLAEVRNRLAQQELGEVRAFHGSFMGADIVNPRTSLFDPARGGGALMHRGVYPLSLARHLMGPVTDVTARGHVGNTGVDEDCAVILRHEAGAISTITASLRAPGANNLMISGTGGVLHVSAPIFRPHHAVWRLSKPRTSFEKTGGRLENLREAGFAQRLNQVVPDALRQFMGGSRSIHRPYAGNGYHYEAAEVAFRLGRNELESPLMPLQESIEIMAVIDEARSQFR
ncbi:MAG: Gfo/Idh/MocA family oxidoreductase [Erythrobacter sp.]|nr:Gfo/Idh/MocA family oxidoreductase [Erythrobacter sp.]